MSKTEHKLVIEAKTENLDQGLEFVENRAVALGGSPRALIQINVAVEEIFVNVAQYAYRHLKEPDASGKLNLATIMVSEGDDPASLTITIEDHGIPFNPLEREDPDTTLSADDRKIGGLGIFMVKKSMDEMKYEYRDGRNILTFRKDL